MYAVKRHIDQRFWRVETCRDGASKLGLLEREEAKKLEALLCSYEWFVAVCLWVLCSILLTSFLFYHGHHISIMFAAVFAQVVV